ncbi:MAG: hypothetical protein U1F25_11265 [Rubrivivax sp.]
MRTLTSGTGLAETGGRFEAFSPVLQALWKPGGAESGNGSSSGLQLRLALSRSRGRCARATSAAALCGAGQHADHARPARQPCVAPPSWRGAWTSRPSTGWRATPAW